MAEEFLTEALFFKPGDGPTEAILEYMKTEEFSCPKDWQGFRVLNEK